jgi:hypothetical protein
MNVEDAHPPWETPATLFLEGTSLTGLPSPRFGATLRGCFYYCLTSPKPTPNWLFIETEDGSRQFRGNAIDKILRSPGVTEEVRKASAEGVWEPRVRSLQR